MTFPTTFEHARDRICELLMSGSGTRPIATGSLSLETAYPGISNEDIATAAKYRPQVEMQFNAFPDPESNLTPSNVSFYNLELVFKLYKALDTEQVKYWRNKVESDLEALAHEIRQVFEYPGNLETKADGTETGIISQFKYETMEKELDWPNKLGVLSIGFSAQAVLANK